MFSKQLRFGEKLIRLETDHTTQLMNVSTYNGKNEDGAYDDTIDYINVNDVDA